MRSSGRSCSSLAAAFWIWRTSLGPRRAPESEAPPTATLVAPETTAKPVTAAGRPRPRVDRDPAARRTGGAGATNRRRDVLVRASGSPSLVAVGFVFLPTIGALSAARDGLLSVLVAVVVLGVILAPWIVRLVRSLTSERSERIRSQERAEVAAHLHDSVLQTLAMVQRSADDPQEVATLARRQERDLRAWLAGRPAPGRPPASSRRWRRRPRTWSAATECPWRW